MPAELLLEVPVQTPEELEAEKFLDSHDELKAGEAPDLHASRVLILAHKAVEKFPEIRKKYGRYVTATAFVVSTAVLVTASIKIGAELSKGKHPSEILEDMTPQDLIPKKHKFSLNKTPNPRSH